MNKIFKYINPIYWIKRRKAKKIYNIIVNAKHFYVQYISRKKYVEMCTCFMKAFEYQDISINMNDIEKHIPEFNRTFCNADNKTELYWWELEDIEPRIKAFNKLIKCYMNKMN